MNYELTYYQQGFRAIAGMDEAGRGPWAGPVSAAMVALPLERADLSDQLKGVRDSKQMTAHQRTRAIDLIKQTAIAWGIGFGTVEEIHQFGIMGALKLAMTRALDMAKELHQFEPDCLFLDYMKWQEMAHIHQLNLKHGDQLSLSIACASVLAKTARDERMLEIAQQYPLWGFDKHKGYGTADHQHALDQHGVSPMHRRNFEPIRQRLRNAQ